MYEPSPRQRVLAVLAAASGVLAVALRVLGGVAVEQVAGVLGGVAVVAALGVLYIHGQLRDSEGGSDDTDENENRRQREAEARKSGGGFS